MQKIVFRVVLIFLIISSMLYFLYPHKVKSKTYYGIDVSRYQENIEWQRVADSGIDFAYIKATEGSNHIDPKFVVNWNNSKKTKILRGGYHFFRPNQNVKMQAKLFVNTLMSNGGCRGGLPPALDIEVSDGVSKKQLEQGIKHWLEFVEKKTGCRPVIYTNLEFWNKYFNDEFLHYKLWLADYNKTTIFPKNLKDQTKQIFLQFKDNSKIGGIKGNVDEDKFVDHDCYLEKLLCK